jgi:peptidoglycan hydrolase-like protein with peptidoglycan-binding domain
MAENGKLSPSELTAIPGGQLANEAAAAWLAPGGPADSGLRPGGDESSYRTIAMQETRWRIYLEGGPLAAAVGTSMHGEGVAIDNPNGWEQSWIAEHGARYGWVKSEAFSEPWHFNYNGKVHFDLFVTLKRGAKGKRVKHYTRRLAFIHHTHGGAYLSRAPGRYGKRVERAVREFQRAYHLHVDGEIGPKTGGKIDAVFHRQYRMRHEAHLPKGQKR